LDIIKYMRYTNSPVQAGGCEGILPEFGRTEDVKRLFGIPRGSLYNLNKKQEVRSVLWRIEGRKSGIRLWYLPGIRERLHAMMNQQSENQTAEPVEPPKNKPVESAKDAQEQSFHE
jgi:hypothetical protein